MRRYLFALIACAPIVLAAGCSRTFPGGDVGLLGQPQFACVEHDLGDPVYVRQVDTTEGGVNMMTGSCGGESSPERVFVWTVPATGLFRVSTVNADFDTVLYLFNGSCSSDEVVCSDDTGARSTSTIDIDAEVGAQIVIAVDGANGEFGSFELRIDPL